MFSNLMHIDLTYVSKFSPSCRGLIAATLMRPYFPPKNQFFSKLQKCIPNSWKQQQKPTKPFHKPLISSNSSQSFSMVGVLIASLKDFVIHNHLPNAFQTFIQIQHHAANSTSNGYFELIFQPIRDLLSSCTNLNYLQQGKQLHAQIISLGIDKNSILISKLVHFYGNVGLLSDAESVTESFNSLNPLHWNMVISLYVRNCLFNEVISVYRKMLSKGAKPDDYTYPSVIKACGELLDYVSAVVVHKGIRDGSIKYLHQGKQLHAQIISLGIDKDSILISKLVHFYGNVGLLSDAESVTENSNSLDPLHWNMVISLYVRNCLFNKAILVYRKMLSKGVKLDDYTYPSVIKACGELLDYDSGVEVHKFIQDGSIKWNLLDVARTLFDIMPFRDYVSWNTIISCYANRGLQEEAEWLSGLLEGLFRQMQKDGMEINVLIWNAIAGVCMHTKDFKGALNLLSQMRRSIQLDSVSMVVGLKACSHIRVVKLGKEIHGHAIRTCFDVFDNVKNALITMYSRCGDLGQAYMLFRKMDEKGLITWNVMLSGFAHMGRAEKVFFLFREMLHEGVKPNFVTVASVLPLCARIKNLQHGKEFHCYMVKRGDQFNDYLLLWNSLVEMYSRSSKISEARKVFDSLSRRDKVTYTSMIMGYGMSMEGANALKLFEEMHMFNIEPDHVTMVAVLLACSHSSLVDQGKFLFEFMTKHYRIIPRVEHYSCMVHLFGKAGLLDKAKAVITGMPKPCRPTLAMWVTLIRACQIYGNLVMGEWAAGKLLEMKPVHSRYYVLIANMYEAAGCRSKLAEVRSCMLEQTSRSEDK